MISNLPGKALRMFVDIARLESDSINVLKAEPGKLDIKRPETGILLISLPLFYFSNKQLRFDFRFLC